MLQVKDNDCIYTPLPLYHTAGGMLGMGSVILFGATMAIRKKFSVTNFWTDCIKYQCTVSEAKIRIFFLIFKLKIFQAAQYIGETCRYLLSASEKPEDKEHCVRIMFGNGLRPQIWTNFVTRFNIKQIGEFYGATEGNSNIGGSYTIALFLVNNFDIAVNFDNTVGAVGFVPRYAGLVYPVALIKCNEETGEPTRGPDGLCIRCKPGNLTYEKKFIKTCYKIYIGTRYSQISY
jgi:solute carrier family 27 (fatty acid transporter), member 1/4